MRIRRVGPTGDRVFGGSQLDFYHDVPEAVALLVLYRLRLNLGEWFADLSQGTPWATKVLGERTQATRDVVVVGQVRETPGVHDILAYTSQTYPMTRIWDCQMTIDTVYGAVHELLRWQPDDMPRPRYGLLGVSGEAGVTVVDMVRADLSTRRAESNITDFQIVRMDSGQWS